MAIVSYILGDCPGCGRKDSFGNVEVFGGKLVYQGCKACSYNKRIPLPKLQKTILYLDQFFFSHGFRGKEQRFLDAAERIARVSSLQLLVAPYSSIHEDETHQWTNRGELFKFIKATSRGHQFALASEVDRFQLLKAFKAWLANEPAEYQREESDALRDKVHGWDGYMRISVGRYIGDIELIRDLKNQSIEGLVGRFDGWRKLTTTFAEDLQAEYEVAGKGYIDSYLEYAARVASGDHNAFFNAPVMSNVVESMLSVVPADVPFKERLRLCAQFLMQSQHFKETPHHKLSAGMFATAKAMVKGGAYTNKERALQRLSGFFFDVSHISTYAPYCDAFVMDQPMADLVAKPTVALERRYGTKVFSLNNWDEFLAWLDKLEASMGDDHKAALATAYPPRQILTTEPTETGSDAGD